MAISLIVAVVMLHHRDRVATDRGSPHAGQRSLDAPGTSSPKLASQPIAKRLTSGTDIGNLRAAIETARKRRAAVQPATTSADSTAASHPPRLPEPISPEYVRDAVKAIVPLVAECYDQALQRRPGISGNLVVKFTVVGEPSIGGVIGESVIDSTASSIEDVQMRECVQETMHAIQIDPPQHGGQVEVEYPFAFSP